MLPPLHGPIRIQLLDASSIPAEPWLRRLHDDALEVVVVKGWWAPEVAAEVVRRLERLGPHPLWQHRDHPDPKRPQTRVLGQPISPSDVHRTGPERGPYFDDAPRFRELLAELFPADQPFEARLGRVLSQLDPGTPVACADDGAGRLYGVATIRCMPRGCGLPPHAENDYMHIPIYDGLRERVQLPRVLSHFMPLALPEAGGELVVHARRWTQPSGAGDLQKFLAEPHEKLQLDPGDLVLFPSGRIFHSVLPARGERSRWTMGGFGAFTSDGSRFLHWA
jgi:hypothetical protein